ncbi:transmembrane protease serine 11D-like [Polypterus senegalus]|uniref:transmembrane protease serine 11D-like n=1 Tax=Polypterus senegalus TaxID=55291 RepID=UPI001964E173|nr:transmembrane protease serine 11D-like [Polypterus senegalus]
MKLIDTKLLKLLAFSGAFLLLVAVGGVIALVVIAIHGNVKCTNTGCKNSTSLINCNCGTLKAATSRIIGGSDVRNGQYPFQVSLQTNNSHICGGTLVSCSWVLTARHCFSRSKNPQDWVAVVGTVNLNDVTSPNIQERVIKNIVYYDLNTSSSAVDNDIALVELQSPVAFNEFVQPACLPLDTTKLTTGQTCTILGWGLTSEKGSPSFNLLQAQINLYNSSECQKQLEMPITKSMICAGRPNGGVDTCQGDSGGPLLCADQETNKWIVAGITSFGKGCGRQNSPGVYTRTTEFNSWIRSYVFS